MCCGRPAKQRTKCGNALPLTTPSPELGTTVEKLKGLLDSESFIDSWDEIAYEYQDGDAMPIAMLTANCSTAEENSYESAIGEIKNRTEWGPLEANNPSMAATLLSPLQGRIGTDDDKESVKRRHVPRQI